MVFEGKQISHVPPRDFYFSLYLVFPSDAIYEVKGPNFPHSWKFQP